MKTKGRMNLENGKSIDTHGMRKEKAIIEAKKFFNEQLKKLHIQNQQYTKLEIITGRGNHSTNHVAVLKPVIQNLLKSQQYRYLVPEYNDGIFIVKLMKTDACKNSAARDS